MKKPSEIFEKSWEKSLNERGVFDKPEGVGDWEEEFVKKFCPTLENGENSWIKNGLHRIEIFDFIRQLLLSKSEEIEMEKKDRTDFYAVVGMHKEYVTPEERNFNNGFNEGLDKAIDILSK